MNFDLQKAQSYFMGHPDDISLDALDLSCLPKHVSIIMDGNGRWAKARGLDRSKGHVAGVDSLRETVTTCVRLGIDALSVYAFSTENWSRPKHEVNLLMQLFANTLLKELPLFHQENVRLRFLGDLEALPKKTYDTFMQGLEETKHNSGMIFALAVNYGSRAEIRRAALSVADDIAQGIVTKDEVDDVYFSSKLYTEGMSDPDLLIRTSGELRLSNYLLWQLAYTEFYVSKLFWPDFDRFEFLRAVAAYQGRDRRFGGVK